MLWSFRRARLRASARAASRAVALIVAVPSVLCSAGQDRLAAQEAPPRGASGFDGQAMDSLVAAVVPFGFSGQVLIARDGEILVHGAYGMADRAAGVPMTLETPIGIASMTKQFTAAAVLKLAQEGRLSLDDTIDRWLDGVPDDKREITLHQLLTHTGAVPIGHPEDFQAKTLDEQVGAILAAPLTGEIGEQWRYANGGYILAAATVQAAAEMPWAEYLRTALFEPAGMRSTGFLHDPPPGPRVARAYVGWDDLGSAEEWRYNPRVTGSGDMVSTVADLWRWDRALREGRILQAEWRNRYFTPQVDAGGARYAYGLFVHEGARGTVIEHGGDTRLGYNGGFFRYPGENAVLLILSNASLSPGRWMRHTVTADLEGLLHGEMPKGGVPAARFPTRSEARALVGTWALSDARIHVVDDGVRLWVAAEGQSAVDRLYARPASASAVAEANGKLVELLDGLLTGPADEAYREALMEEGAEHLGSYLAEWTALLAALGPFERYSIPGSIPGRDEVISVVHLRFRDGWMSSRYFWLDNGQGRLGGTRPSVGRAYPVFTPAGIDEAGNLVIHDPWYETTVRASVTSDRLRFEDGTLARRIGPVTWSP